VIIYTLGCLLNLIFLSHVWYVVNGGEGAGGREGDIGGRNEKEGVEGVREIERERERWKRQRERKGEVGWEGPRKRE